MRRAGAVAAFTCMLTAGCRETPRPDHVVRLVAHDYSFDVPSELEAGIVHLRLVNEGNDVHEALVVRLLADSGSAERYVAHWRAGDGWPAFAADVGGTALVAQGDSSDAWLRLTPGRYVVVCTKGDHLHRGMAADLVVRAPRTGLADTTPPVADLTLELFEYAYRFPSTVTAGAHVIHVTNRGSEPHEMDIYRVPPGRSVGDFVTWSDSGEHGPPPLEPAGGGGDLLPGGESWIRVNLTPGRYVIICTIPQGAAHDGRPHHALGMLWPFVVE